MMSVPAPQPHVVRPQAYTPQVVRSPAFEPPVSGHDGHDDGEDTRSRRTRMVAVAIVVAALVLGGVVAVSTGLLGRLLPGHAPKATVGADAAAPAVTQGTETVAPDAPPQPAGATGTQAVPPAHAAAAATAQTAFGIQVAAFHTAGRAQHALKDLEDTTHLPGEVLFADGPDSESWYRIVLGRFTSESAARASAKDLLDKSLIAEAIVIPYTPREP
jgi:cell division septation protein DedD